MRHRSTIDHRPSTFAAPRRAFTLIELLVVIGIIALLMAVLFPTISRMRLAAQETDTRSLINQLDAACQSYYQAFRAYPGPLSNDQLDASPQFPVRDGSAIGTVFNAGTATGGPAPVTPTVTGLRITGAENMALGLLGGLALDRATGNYFFDASSFGQGPANFNPIRPGRATAFLQTANVTGLPNLPPVQGAYGATDTIIPEFVDRFAEAKPILYLRSRNTGLHVGTTTTLVTADPAATTSDFSLLHALPYTSFGTGGLKTVTPAATMATKPYDAYPYLTDPTTASTTTGAERRSRKKESYVLISAGRDRLYGTADDVTNFGGVLP